jgi:hypothetical protein
LNYNVTFHYEKDNSVTLTVDGTNEQSVLNTIYSNGDYFDGTYKTNVGLQRVNLKLVNYVSVFPAKN